VRILFSDHAWEDYLFWQENDREILSRLSTLIKETRRTPFAGIGKPEPLRGDLQGWWSRRITIEHRLIYRVAGQPEAQVLEIMICRFHYLKKS
jgi:toxin YoeB